jgi:hypothetical protein
VKQQGSPAQQGPARKLTPFVQFVTAVIGLAVAFTVLGVGVGLSVGLAHRTYRWVIR